VVHDPELHTVFLAVIDQYTAGLPTNAQVKWTNLSRAQLAEHLAAAGKSVSIPVVDQLLAAHHFRKRRAYRNLARGHAEARDAQFRKISELIRSYQAARAPVLSMDVKKKEWIGQFFREGAVYTQDRIQVYDHDFRSLAKGIVIPHGLYDLTRNIGYITLGTSRDTSEFACDCLRHYWRIYGQDQYPYSHTLLLLCDCGGSNNARHYVFKEQLQQLANTLMLEIRVAHYPPYTSKYNPIEHRLFSQIARACQGVVFSSLDVVKAVMETTSTRTGLRVFVTICDKEYVVGRKASADFRARMPIVFDRELPQWNYRAIPTAW
jgi:hypothetical protein